MQAAERRRRSGWPAGSRSPSHRVQPRSHVLEHRKAEVAKPIELMLVRKFLKVDQAGDGRRELLRKGGGRGGGV